MVNICFIILRKAPPSYCYRFFIPRLNLSTSHCSVLQSFLNILQERARLHLRTLHQDCDKINRYEGNTRCACVCSGSVRFASFLNTIRFPQHTLTTFPFLHSFSDNRRWSPFSKFIRSYHPYFISTHTHIQTHVSKRRGKRDYSNWNEVNVYIPN